MLSPALTSAEAGKCTLRVGQLVNAFACLAAEGRSYIRKSGLVAIDRYDIVAQATPGICETTLGLMLQSFLASELKLVVHEEQRPMDAFALVIAKDGAKLTPAAGPGHVSCLRPAVARIDCESVEMTGLIASLRFFAGDYIGRPVVDQTGLRGTWALKTEWTPRNIADNSGGVTVFEALTKQAGLKPEQRKLAVPVTVIDHAERPEPL